MKLLLVFKSNTAGDIIANHMRPLGFELIRYRNVIKAMDNVDEIDPSAIVISAGDFPRHWKIMVQFVRSERAKENCPIVVLKNSAFPTEECSKAYFLGVSGLVDESLDSFSELDRLQKILSRYAPVIERRRFNRFHVDSRNDFGFLFTNPANRIIVTGELKTISAGNVSFLPNSSAMTRDITLHMELDQCSLRVGGDILSPACRLVRTGRMISLEFIAFPNNEQQILDNYLAELPLHDFKMKKGA